MRDPELDSRTVVMSRSFYPEIPVGTVGVALGTPYDRWLPVAWETGHIRKMFSVEIKWQRYSDGRGLYPFGAEHLLPH